MEVLYTYPPYTRLQPRTDHTREGTIDAIAGTAVRVTMHPSEMITTARLAIDDTGAGSQTLPLLPGKVDAAPATAPAAGLIPLLLRRI